MFEARLGQPVAFILVLKQRGDDLCQRALICRFNQMSARAESFDVRGDTTGDDGRKISADRPGLT